MRESLPVIILLLPAIASAGAPVDFGNPVDCREAKFTPETTICNYGDLRASDAAIALAYRKLASAYRGEDHKVFVAGQEFWTTERNGCRSSPAGDQYACLKAKFGSRLAVLEDLLREPAGLARTVSSYRVIRMWYLLKFANQYEGKDVYVPGGLDLKGCYSHGPISTSGRLRDGDAEIEIRFSRLDDAARSFLCAKAPYAWWSATVRVDDGHPYLYATEVLGRAL